MSLLSFFSGDGKVEIKTGQMPGITVREGDFKDVTCQNIKPGIQVTRDEIGQTIKW